MDNWPTEISRRHAGVFGSRGPRQSPGLLLESPPSLSRILVHEWLGVLVLRSVESRDRRTQARIDIAHARHRDAGPVRASQTRTAQRHPRRPSVFARVAYVASCTGVPSVPAVQADRRQRHVEDARRLLLPVRDVRACVARRSALTRLTRHGLVRWGRSVRWQMAGGCQRDAVSSIDALTA